MFWVRCAAALVLAPILSGEVIQSGPGVYGDFLTLLFPYLWLFLAVDYLLVKRHLKDEHVFMTGAAFGLLYNGVYTMSLHDGASPLGVNWAALLAVPAEWGMFLVLLFKVLGAIFPRGAGHFKGKKAGWAAVAAIGLVAVGRYYIRLENGTFILERMIGGAWPLVNLAFAALAAAALRKYRGVELEGGRKGSWVWVLGGASVWVLGASLLAQMFGGGWNAAGQAGWVLMLWAAGVYLWGAKGRNAGRWLMGAAAVRLIGALVFAVGDGISGRPQAQFLASVFVDLPVKALFLHGFLAGRHET